MSQKLKNEIFVDLNRAGHDKSVEKKNSVLAQMFTKLWSIYELHIYIIIIIILNIIQGRPQDLGGGGAKNIFFRFGNLHVAKRHAYC